MVDKGAVGGELVGPLKLDARVCLVDVEVAIVMSAVSARGQIQRRAVVEGRIKRIEAQRRRQQGGRVVDDPAVAPGESCLKEEGG